MNILLHIITDDIMEQIELSGYIPEGQYTCSINPPDIRSIDKDKQICFIVNVHASSFDAMSFLHLYDNIKTESNIEIIAYTSEMHDLQTIHAVKSIGIQHMCTKAQLVTFLQSIGANIAAR